MGPPAERVELARHPWQVVPERAELERDEVERVGVLEAEEEVEKGGEQDDALPPREPRGGEELWVEVGGGGGVRG